MLPIEPLKEVIWSSEDDALGELPIILVAKTKCDVLVTPERVDFVAIEQYRRGYQPLAHFIVDIAAVSVRHLIIGVHVVKRRLVWSQRPILDGHCKQIQGTITLLVFDLH
ncbi:hypothetical protein SNOG_20067 [Parastagonospora nodorum SN15]|uniref:Uncharacterized protein n=1 Tax=Phaeosphaeria nodorum (strain SN15 / ATCC MYA-4574 / FGSC 10173) TaxID=321614 RepID=A9JX64_PHANO|nr:hypothetical protein SNOG_20067 [Parastagonospora nodorum SN15]EDP89923.1 hypothetical protein SNOG_20067 [Parastagonospora nodorum SN15]